MVLPRYLAMTREEFAACPQPPRHMGWMACHFSPYGTGLTNLPPALPRDSMIILNDRIPMEQHDPQLISEQLMELDPGCLLLDFQRPCGNGQLELAKILTGALPCPVAVSPMDGYDGTVFLPPVPPDVRIEEYLRPWQGREIWLEISRSPMAYRITEAGSRPTPLSQIPCNGMESKEFCCHYRLEHHPNRVEFHIWRTESDLERLLEKAAPMGVTKAVGLWQELH